MGRSRLMAAERFIPACAGNSVSYHRHDTPMPGSSPRVRGTRTCAATRKAMPTVHPRVCGELVLDRLFPDGVLRFIPACAGNSLCTTRTSSTAAVHPRVCGELS